MWNNLFKLEAHGTTVRREITAGLTTFAAMAYILAVNPAILGQSGMDRAALVTATAIASALMTAVMALATNYPLALAPGMGLNAFFTFSLCLGSKIPWQAALGLVFYGGAIFFLLSVTGVRRLLIEAIPKELKLAVTCGIGLFIAFIGLKNAGVIVSNPATFVALGDFRAAGAWMTLAGVVVAAALIWRGTPGAIVITVLGLAAAGLFVTAGGAPITAKPAAWIAAPASLSPSFLKFDLAYFWNHLNQCVPLLITLLFVDLFDNMGTLIGVCHRAGLLDKEGRLPRIGAALMADAAAAMIGSVLGTSTVTSYIESAAGVEAGGRTGLTALVAAACFLVALVFHPVITVIPAIATAPALVIVGVFMMQSVVDLDLADFRKAVPAVVTMLAMPLTFSIAKGLALGFVVFVGLNVLTGNARKVTPIAYLLTALFAWQLGAPA
jgi:adenine/guanine/hypoxanthine permease